jgi:hypothetical protein
MIFDLVIKNNAIYMGDCMFEIRIIFFFIDIFDVADEKLTIIFH